jgi:serine/threonine protein phosphatase 1
MEELPLICRKAEVRHLAANAAGRDFIVGDIHGHYEALLKLMAAANFDKKKDRMFCSGDLIDRGPDPVWSASLVNEPWFHSTLGNHDLFLVRNVARRSKDEKKFRDDAFEIGGAWALGQDQGTLEAIATELQKLPHVLTVGEGAERFNVVHAAMRDNYGYLTDSEVDQINDRSECPWFVHDLTEDRQLWRSNLREEQPGLSMTYCGHTPNGALAYNRSHLCLDLGSGHPNWVDQIQRLGLLCHQDKTLWTIKTNDRNAQPEMDTEAYARLNIEPAIRPVPNLPEQVHLPADLNQRLAAAKATDSHQASII